MAGWLTLMLIVAVAGREATREVNVFELMQMRCVIGFVMLYPLIRMSGGFAAMKLRGRCNTSYAISSITLRSSAGSSR